ncbi:cysteine synthase A [Ostreibacterium oceani]|uniref:Cysteine synthase n=1 Tax=Ostreibacterium oceani TaxID=2654998 RepID=A0A6N7F4I7_9GAMM|nr:cysteine synthase A [Ostreibacterium oceani]MPV86806.1 cysteine synthase A [Ostreibacterium oceani]
MRKIIQNVTELVGNTPLFHAKTLSTADSDVLLKLEYFNPGFSVKDRIALSIIETAEANGELKPGMEIIEATSGNTGIGLACIAAAKGYPLTITMPESMSLERRKLLTAYGAKLVLTPKELGMKGAVAKASELAENSPNAFLARQFDNPANPDIHYRTTGPEIWEQTGGNIDIFISGVGTGGTITGAGKYLKEKNPNLKIIAVEPIESAVLSGEPPAPHKIQGIGAGFIPTVLDTSLYDEVFQVNVDDGVRVARELAKSAGVLVGISGGAMAYVAQQFAKNEPGKQIVTITPSNGERYLTTFLYDIAQ